MSKEHENLPQQRRSRRYLVDTHSPLPPHLLPRSTSNEQLRLPQGGGTRPGRGRAAAVQDGQGARRGGTLRLGRRGRLAAPAAPRRREARLLPPRPQRHRRREHLETPALRAARPSLPHADRFFAAAPLSLANANQLTRAPATAAKQDTEIRRQFFVSDAQKEKLRKDSNYNNTEYDRIW